MLPKTHRPRRAFGLVLCFAALTATPLPATACEAFWQPRLLAQASGAAVELRDGRRTVATIPTKWFIAVNHINRRINAASGVDANFLLCASSEPNAFAWHDADGAPFVALTLGLRDLLGDDWHAYAAILGHENAHLVRGHGRKRQQRETVAALGQLLGGALLSGAGGLVADSVRITAQAATSSYSQEDEHQADRDGMHYAHAAGFDPRGALTLHAKLKSASHFLRSHPSSADRIRRLKNELRRNGW